MQSIIMWYEKWQQLESFELEKRMGNQRFIDEGLIRNKAMGFMLSIDVVEAK
jgi:hypothetical protein